MAMSKTAPITNYFKRLNQSFQRKRPFPDDESEESRESSRRKSPIHEFNDNQDAHRSSDASQPSSQPSRQSLADKSPQSSPQDSPPFRQKLPARTISSPNSNKYGKPEPHQPQSRGLASPCIDKDTILTRQPDFATPAPGAAGTPSSKDKLHETPTIAPNKATTHYHSMTSSQPTLPSSQRIVRNGETMIRNSDDESDASLKDIDELFDGGRQSPEANSQLPSPDDEGSHRPKRTTRGIRPARKSHSQLPSGLPVMPKKHKFSLEALVKQKKKDEASKDEIARAESMLESYDQRKGSTGRGKGLLDTSLIDSVMKDHGDEDDIGKLKSAIQRTEALQHAKSWSFFDDDAEDTTSQVSEFPVVQDERLERLFGEPLPRQQAFLSGYAGEFATKRDLPEEILLWIMDALCMESRDDLRYSYASTLRHATEQLTPLLTPNYMDVLFQKLGAAATALNFETLIVPHATISQSVEATHRPGLLSLLAVLGSAAGDLSAESRVHLLNTLCRLTLDRSIVKSCHAIGVIEEAIASLIESLPEEDLQHEVGNTPRSEQTRLTTFTRFKQ